MSDQPSPDLFGYTPPSHSPEPDIQANGDDHRGKWPELLQDLRAAVTGALQRDGYAGAEADKIASTAVLCVAEYAGGRQIYLPTGAKLRRAIRDTEIYARFNGRNVQQLGREYKMTDKRIYEIIAIQREQRRGR